MTHAKRLTDSIYDRPTAPTGRHANVVFTRTQVTQRMQRKHLHLLRALCETKTASNTSGCVCNQHTQALFSLLFLCPNDNVTVSISIGIGFGSKNSLWASAVQPFPSRAVGHFKKLSCGRGPYWSSLTVESRQRPGYRCEHPVGLEAKHRPKPCHIFAASGQDLGVFRLFSRALCGAEAENGAGLEKIRWSGEQAELWC